MKRRKFFLSSAQILMMAFPLLPKSSSSASSWALTCFVLSRHCVRSRIAPTTTSVSSFHRGRRRRRRSEFAKPMPLSFSSSSSSSSSSSDDKDADASFLRLAVHHAARGLGHTFPNPAVGCVLVRRDDGEIVGEGFHPRAGYPHAEIFALFEAAGHVESGVEAARAVVNDPNGSSEEMETVRRLTERYASEGGPEQLFDPSLLSVNDGGSVTAYVTLEPCCHFGKTPPCAASLIKAGVVSRVVVGFRDPNPRVNGGGVRMLEEAGIQTDVVTEEHLHDACASLVTQFVKRVAPRQDGLQDYDSYMTGKMRRGLRSLSLRLSKEGRLENISWGGGSVDMRNDGWEDAVHELDLSPEWMENLDAVLWNKELVVVRLNKAVSKKKGAKLLGQRIADLLGAHVAQTKGHTALLYRPGIPPVLDLEKLDTRAGKEDQ